nr:global nitrogen transcriptional regulator [Hypnea sp.]
MKWINFFLNFNIPFSIYKLHRDDSIIFSKYIKFKRPMIMLYGIVYILKTFTNNTTKTIAILEAGNIIYINQIKDNSCHYKISAITKTFLVSFKWQDLIKSKINPQIFKEFIKIYIKTKEKYEIMNTIMSHKYIQNRVIQLILIFGRDFGVINKSKVTIPYYISQNTVAIISGSNRTTINKILNYLYKYKIIQYSNDKKIIINKPFLFLYLNNRKIKKHKH